MKDINNFAKSPTIYLVDDDKTVLRALSRAIQQYDLEIKTYSSARLFLDSFNNESGCLVLDLSMPEMDGLELQAELARLKLSIPIIFITGHGGVAESVKALRDGAVDFLEKPFPIERLLDSIREALELDSQNRVRINKENDLRECIARLTARERDIYDLLIEAEEAPSSKEIARILSISHRTVEHHRSRILEKLRVHTVVELRLTVANALLTS